MQTGIRRRCWSLLRLRHVLGAEAGDRGEGRRCWGQPHGPLELRDTLDNTTGGLDAYGGSDGTISGAVRVAGEHRVGDDQSRRDVAVDSDCAACLAISSNVA